MPQAENLKEATAALARMQSFDTATLPRIEDLGRELNFSIAVKPAQDVIDLYRRVPVSILQDLTDEQLNNIKAAAQADYNVLNEILTFTTTRADANQHRQNLIATLQQRRDKLFPALWQFISYGVARVTDTSVLEAQARATIQSINDKANAITEDLAASKKAADDTLAHIRSIAAEQGVSQQAEYFKREADAQDVVAGEWLDKAYKFAGAVGAFAVLSLFLHKFPWLKPENNYETVQLVISKVLIFAVLGYLLIMSARNYMSSKHNAVVNRHRQNALLTYRAIAEAAGQKGTEDIILANAAACIFSPQESGYNGHGASGDSGGTPKSVLELMTKGVAKAEA